MIIRTRRDLPAMSWLQTRSKFCLTIDKHPLKTGFQTLAWLEPYSLTSLKTPTQRNRWMTLSFGLLCAIGIMAYSVKVEQVSANASLYDSSYINSATIHSSTIGMNRSDVLAPQPAFFIQSWSNGWKMWKMAQQQWQEQLVKVQSQKQYKEQMALAADISTEYRIAPQAAQRVVRQAYQAASKQGVDPVLLLAVVGVESRFNPLAGSDAGAVGLVQALARAHPDKVGSALADGGSLTDVDVNLNLGAQILKEYLTIQKGNTPRALQAYKGSLSDSSQAYAHKVLAVKARFDKVLNSRNV